MRTSIQLDTKISEKLKILANHENRTKVDEIRFLVQREIQNLNISELFTPKITPELGHVKN